MPTPIIGGFCRFIARVRSRMMVRSVELNLNKEIKSSSQNMTHARRNAIIWEKSLCWAKALYVPSISVVLSSETGMPVSWLKHPHYRW